MTTREKLIEAAEQAYRDCDDGAAARKDQSWSEFMVDAILDTLREENGDGFIRAGADVVYDLGPECYETSSVAAARAFRAMIDHIRSGNTTP